MRVKQYLNFWISVLVRLAICLHLLCSVSFSVSPLSCFWVRGAVQKWMSPLSQCYLGEIDSLASVLLAAICWGFHVPDKWGWGVAGGRRVKTAKVKITTWTTLLRRKRGPFCNVTSAVKAPVPQSCEVLLGFESTTLMLALHWNVFFYFAPLADTSFMGF